MPRKTMMFVGAPKEPLNWAEANMLHHFLHPIAHFAGLEIVPEEIPKADPTVWRSMPLHRERLKTGFSQTHALAHVYQGNANAGFFTPLSTSFGDTSNLSEDGPDEDTINQFYDHSVALHGDVSSSQLASQSFATDDSSFDTTQDLSEERSTQREDESIGPQRLQETEFPRPSDLKGLPGAKHLLSISPQTMTVNLIVGIISIAEPRMVKTRWGATESLVELLVGDETKSGFSITFWMSSKPSDSNTLVRSLRRQDIILLRNVALGVFMNKVHGHSLRKGYTRVGLLHRRRIDKDDMMGIYSMKDVSSARRANSQLAKVRKVWEWLLHFVGDGGTSLGKRKYGGKPIRGWDMPPADTQ